MCGIVCYSGKHAAVPFLLEGLERLEYRGYDSAGIAVGMKDKKPIYTQKSVGNVASLISKTNSDVSGTYGIAHTRWATHGESTVENAHPHSDCSGKLMLVHNGIIENYNELKQKLIKEGHRFRSDTDTEVLAHLIESFIENHNEPNLEKATRLALQQISGTFGIAVLHQCLPNKIVLAKRGSPLVIGLGNDEYMAASDVNAFIRHTNKVLYLNDDEMAVLNSTDFTITDLNLNAVEKHEETIDWEYEENALKGFKHFMLKEIFEQPKGIENAMRGRVMESEGISKLGGLQPVADQLKKINNLTFLSCGTSYYAGLYGKYVFNRLNGLNVSLEYASEFRYMDLKISEKDCILAISQSGETADTLAALKEAKRKGALTLGLVNVVGSSISKVTDAGVYNHAGPEIGVASTKIFTSQCVILTLIALFAGRNQHLSVNEGIRIVRGLKALPEQIRNILKQSEYIRKLAEKYLNAKGFYFIGRHFNYPVAREGALKLKEISYIHAEGYPAGEMKHGAISLIDEQFPTIALATRDFSYEKMVSNIQEVKARKAPVLAVISESDHYLPELVDNIIKVPETLDILQPILNVIPLQLFAYHVADLKGREIDKPRNLAKSVTVE